MKLKILEIFGSAAQEHNQITCKHPDTTRQIEKLNHEEQPSTNEVCDRAETQAGETSTPTRKTQRSNTQDTAT
jgi:hypothetical protein